MCLKRMICTIKITVVLKNTSLTCMFGYVTALLNVNRDKEEYN